MKKEAVSILRAVAAAVALGLITACGGGGDGSGGGTGSAPPPAPPPAPAPAPAPTGLTYASPQTWIVGQPVTALNPTVTGAVTSYSVTPALPAGISLNASTGQISGTPSAVAAQASYTVTASNSSGSTTFALTATVNPTAPTALSYPSPQTLVVGTALAAPVRPSVTGTVSSYAVAPALPAGLQLDAATGAISGTPTAEATSATYTVTARNVTGSTTFALQLAVNPAAPSALVYPPGGARLPVGVAAAVDATVNGRVTSWSVTPSLPRGLSIGPNGQISGTPRESRALATYRITASNISGSTTGDLLLETTTPVAPAGTVLYRPFEINNPTCSYGGAQQTMHRWNGRNVVILTETTDYNPGAMQLMLRGLDAGYDYYAQVTQRTPALNAGYHLEGRLTIAITPCLPGAAGRGFLGVTGIEIERGFFRQLFDAGLNNNEFGSFIYYELGRNFFFYLNKAAVPATTQNFSDGVITGFAILMSWASMEYANVRQPLYAGVPHEQAFEALSRLVDIYLADTTLNWTNTIGARANVPRSGPYGGHADLFASIFTRLRRDEPRDFLARFWPAVAARPNATNEQQSIDNIVLAASAAANRNLTRYFSDTLRWPVSDAARAEAQTRFGSP